MLGPYAAERGRYGTQAYEKKNRQAVDQATVTRAERSPWLDLERRVACWLERKAGTRLEFRNGYQAIPGYPADGFRADALLTDGASLLAVEVEVKQTHPDTNVGKYWLLAEHRRYQHVVLLQVYTPGYNSYPWRKRLAEYYAIRMQRELPFEYHQLDLRTSTSVDTAFSICVEQMEAHVQRVFPTSRPRVQ